VTYHTDIRQASGEVVGNCCVDRYGTFIRLHGR